MWLFQFRTLPGAVVVVVFFEREYILLFLKMLEHVSALRLETDL